MSDRTASGETYLGDGLYASFDGFQICLRAPREDGDHLVFLEPLTLKAFQQYVVDMIARLGLEDDVSKAAKEEEPK